MEKIEIINKLFKSPHKEKNVKTTKTRDKKPDIKNDIVKLSSKAISLSKPQKSEKSSKIRIGLVKKFKEGVSNGTYKVKTDEIAEKLIQKLKEETYYKPFL